MLVSLTELRSYRIESTDGDIGRIDDLMFFRGEWTVRYVVEDGWATLRGTVDAFWKRLRAEERALTLSGVRGVTNEPGVMPSRAYEDRRIAESIVSALERNVHTDAEHIDVRVSNG